jgi:predicted Rdx family selenoprotein
MSTSGPARERSRVKKLVEAVAAKSRGARWALARAVNQMASSPTIALDAADESGRTRRTGGSSVTETSIPLTSFGVQYGAALSEDGRLIRFDGSHTGIVVYGPRLKSPRGLYVFTVDINTLGRRFPNITVEIWSDQGPLALQRVTTHARQVSVTTLVPSEQLLEVRIHTHHDPFEISDIRYESFALDQLSQAEGRRENRADVRRRIKAVLGLSRDTVVDAEREAWSNIETVNGDVFSRNAVTSVPVGRLYEYEPQLRSAGLSPCVIRHLFERNNTHLEVDAGLVEGDLVQGYPKFANAFQQEIVRNGAFRTVSPFSGEPVETSNGLPVISYNGAIISLVYEFAGPNPMIIGASTGWTGSISFLWLVEQELIIFQSVADSDWTNAQQVICAHISQCARHHAAVQDYRAADKTVALATGFISNMGHYFWNESSGFERMVRLTGLKNVDMVYARAGAWMDMTEIFADDIKGKTLLVPSGGDLFELAVQNRHIVVRPIGGQYDDALTAKVRRATDRLLKRNPPPPNPDLQRLGAEKPYVLFVNLRAHNKSWIEQKEGIVGIAEMLGRARGEPVVVYLDGYVDCDDTAKEIAAHAIDNVTFVIGTRASFVETLDWAFRADFFIAVIGSGLVPLTWVANKPGLAYGDTRHLGQMDWWGQVRHDSAEVTWPTAEHVKDTEDLFYANYSIKPKLMMAMFAKRVL